MKKLLARSLLAAFPLTAFLALTAATPALAHERRTVTGFQFVVGWGDEPAYSANKNSVQLILSDANGGAPITDLGDGVKVEVIKGGDKVTLPMVAKFGTPGDYRAYVTPTLPGTYTFHFTGTIHGQAIDQSFTSSKTTFNDVEDLAAIEFPTKDPSTGQLATRIDREVPRLEARADTVQANVRTTNTRVDSAHTVAVVGVGVGALGVIVGALALVLALRSRSRREAAPAGTATAPAQKAVSSAP